MAEIIDVQETEFTGEFLYRLKIDGQIVSDAKVSITGLRLEIIHTVPQWKRKGYGSKLIRRIEKDVSDDAKKRGQATVVFDTSDIDSADAAAVEFFKKNGYTLTPEEGMEGFLVGRKTLDP
jgi:GNAT superfamily N-acetyltransferase